MGRFAMMSLMVAILVPASAFAGEYTVYSWLPGAKVAVRAAECDSFSKARSTADVLAAMHSIKGLPQMDNQFSMISEVGDPLTTWVLQSNEPFQPHEYYWVGDHKDDHSSRN